MYNDNKYIFIEATQKDNEAIKKIYESISYPGIFDISFLRGQNPYNSIITEGEDSVILLCKRVEDNSIVGLGSCCIHKMYVDGEIKRVGYLNGLKIISKYQKANTSLIKGFSLMGDLLKEKTDLCIATILKSSVYTQKMFEKKRMNMPLYNRQCIYTTFLIKPAHFFTKLNLTRGYNSEVEKFYRENIRCYNLAKVNEIRGVHPEDYIIWKRNGRIIAACVVFNDQQNKNYYLNKYGKIFRLFTFFPTQLFGLPKFPKEKSVVNTATISNLLFDESVSVSDRRKFIRAASSFAKDFDIVLVGATDTDPTYKALNKIMHISLTSYLYTVDWKEPNYIASRPILCDVAIM